MSERSRQDLAEDLRWLADQWRAASPERKKKIEAAFARGLKAGDPVAAEMEQLDIEGA